MARQMSKRAAKMARSRLNKQIADLRSSLHQPMLPVERDIIFEQVNVLSARIPALTAIIGDGGAVTTDSLIS